MVSRKGIEKALDMMKYLPRVSKDNVIYNPGEVKKHCMQGQHGGGTRGHGKKGAKQRCSYPRLGFENGNKPMYIRMPRERYFKNYTYRRQYPPVTLKQLQLMIDTGRIDASQPIDLTSICNTKFISLQVWDRNFGIQLTDEGADQFTAKVNIEVQHAKETVIAAIERNGGVISNTYYDIDSVLALVDPETFFRKGVPIPHRKLPPEDILPFYMDPKTRGYLADPEKIAEERYALAQKYGYKFIDISEDPDFEMLTARKDPRQVFFGLEPGWLVNLTDKTIFEPLDEVLQAYYKS